MTIKNAQYSDIPQLRDLWKQAFGDSDDFLNTFFDTAFSADRCRCVFLNDGIPLSVLYFFECSYSDVKAAYLYAVATDVRERGKGLCRMLLQDTHKYLAEKGYSCAILVPGSRELFGFYERAGYASFGGIDKFSCKAAGRPVEIQKADKAEYARLRRSYLPEKGVIQENESLDFLKAGAELYKGEDFLLVARINDGKLYGIELLGNTALAERIVMTLNCTEGTFRTAGNSFPFAMYRPLGSNSIEPPSYFGLAFD